MGILVVSKREGATDGSLVIVSIGGALTICEGCKVFASVGTAVVVELSFVHKDVVNVLIQNGAESLESFST